LSRFCREEKKKTPPEKNTHRLSPGPGGQAKDGTLVARVAPSPANRFSRRRKETAPRIVVANARVAEIEEGGQRKKRGESVRSSGITKPMWLDSVAGGGGSKPRISHIASRRRSMH
jgi:hypothetical protein